MCSNIVMPRMIDVFALICLDKSVKFCEFVGLFSAEISPLPKLLLLSYTACG